MCGESVEIRLHRFCNQDFVIELENQLIRVLERDLHVFPWLWRATRTIGLDWVSTVDLDQTDILDIEGENSHIVSFVAPKIKPQTFYMQCYENIHGLSISPADGTHPHHTHTHTLRPSLGFWGTGEKGYLFQLNRGTKVKFWGERGTKTILGNREHKKTNFQCLGNRGTSQFISGEQGDEAELKPAISND